MSRIKGEEEIWGIGIIGIIRIIGLRGIMGRRGGEWV